MIKRDILSMYKVDLPPCSLFIVLAEIAALIIKLFAGEPSGMAERRPEWVTAGNAIAPAHTSVTASFFSASAL